MQGFKRGFLVIVGALVVLVGTTASGCDSKRQIDVQQTDSFPIEGTSWYGFCQGRNAFIFVPGKTDSDPDELEAVIYDDYRCIGQIKPGATPTTSSKPDTDPDGIIDDQED